MPNHAETSNTLDALKNFDSLPDSANVREPVVCALYGFSHGTLWNYAKLGIIPAPRKIGPRVTVWNVGELRRSLAQHAA